MDRGDANLFLSGMAALEAHTRWQAFGLIPSFADDRQRAAWLALLGTTSGIHYEATIERTLDRLADHCEAHLDCDALLAAAR